MSATSVQNPPVMGMKVVLNGGSKTLESATMPIQWFFDESVAAKRPQWILVVCQNIDKSKDDGYMSRYRGTRSVYHVTDRIGFIQLHRAGPYRILVTALSSDPRKKLVRDDVDSYEHGVLWPSHKDFDPSDYAAYATDEFEVPDGMFAKRSETWLGKLLWKWINRWHETTPRDQCQYRARAIIAFTVQPVIVGISYLLRYAFATIGTAYLLLARTMVAYFGYRPVNLFLGLKSLWSYDIEPRYLDWQVKAYKKESYRVWRRPENHRWASEFDVKIPFTPFIASIIVGGAWGAYKLYPYLPEGFFLTLLAGLLVIVVIVSVFIGALKFLFSKRVSGWVQGMRASSEKKKEEACLIAETERQREVDSYMNWLKSEMSVARAPARVNLEHLPKPFKNPVAHRIRTKFWAAKLAVCKPFAR